MESRDTKCSVNFHFLFMSISRNNSTQLLYQPRPFHLGVQIDIPDYAPGIPSWDQGQFVSAPVPRLRKRETGNISNSQLARRSSIREFTWQMIFSNKIRQLIFSPRLLTYPHLPT